MTPTNTTEPEQSAHDRAYAVICLAALLLVVVMLMLEGMGVWSVLPMLVGGIAFLLRWRSGPPIVVFLYLLMAPTHVGFERDLRSSAAPAVAGADKPPRVFVSDPEPIPYLYLILGWMVPVHNATSRRLVDSSIHLEDVLLAVGLVTYVVACYRAMALSHSVIPPEYTRLRGSMNRGPLGPAAKTPTPLIARPGASAGAAEVPLLFGALGCSLLGGFVLWLASGLLPIGFEDHPAILRNVVAFWLWVLVVSLSLAYFRFLGRLRAPAEENVLYLQDQLWRITRHEQGVLNRWLVWARLRGQRRKEQ
jgi:hypothetical protein